ncbi:hypothetical protein CYMTET_14113 [Cymbomonas tetramitiformis]|uniref:Uncharacterized protein n=1 Tax=Cymbomonas tetramitiformis TaxID=36881 RepID=A0AAE0GHA0_9CHLO|nr:hypothetical protein CYMTET_14113 [Cymbomonas tetramitiformis]
MEDPRAEQGSEGSAARRADDPRAEQGSERNAARRVDDPRAEQGSEGSATRRADDPRAERGGEGKEGGFYRSEGRARLVIVTYEIIEQYSSLHYYSHIQSSCHVDGNEEHLKTKRNVRAFNFNIQ